MSGEVTQQQDHRTQQRQPKTESGLGEGLPHCPVGITESPGPAVWSPRLRRALLQLLLELVPSGEACPPLLPSPLPLSSGPGELQL